MRRLGATAAANGSLKRLQAILETRDSSGTVAATLMPFYVIYDLRIAYSHLTSATRREELISTSASRLGVSENIALPELYSELLDQVTAAMRKLEGVIR